MVDHRAVEYPFRPFHRVAVRPLARQEQGAEPGQVVLPDQLAVWVRALDGAKGGRCREQGVDAVLGDDPPVDAGVRRADRLALEQDRGASVEQRRVDDIELGRASCRERVWQYV